MQFFRVDSPGLEESWSFGGGGGAWGGRGVQTVGTSEGYGVLSVHQPKQPVSQGN